MINLPISAHGGLGGFVGFVEEDPVGSGGPLQAAPQEMHLFCAQTGRGNGACEEQPAPERTS